MMHRIGVVAIALVIGLSARTARAQNAPPTAREVHLTTAMQTAATGLLDGSDPNGDPLTFSIATQPQKGAVVLTDVHSGAFTYTPHELLNGADMFTFQVSDGATTSAPARVSIAIIEAHPENIAIGLRAAAVAPAGLVPAPELVDGDLATSWKSDPRMTGNQIIAINLGELKRVWRVVIHWAPGGHARSYFIKPVNLLFRTTDGDGGIDDLQFAANQAFSGFRLEIGREPEETGRTYEIQEIEIYATETFNHVSHNPPYLENGDIWDATTYAPLTDGDASTGVVSPFLSDPLQFVTTAIFPVPNVARLVLFWGDDYATHYQIMNCFNVVVLDKTDGRGGVETVDLPTPFDGTCINVLPIAGPRDRFELREIEMYGPFPDNVAAGKNTVASSEASATEGSAAAVDRDLLTTWVSTANPGPVWWLVDVGFEYPRRLCGIRIWWGDQFPTSYAIFTLEEGSVVFEPYHTTDRGDGGLDFVDGPNRKARYVVIVAPHSDVGYAIREFEVYRCPTE